MSGPGLFHAITHLGRITAGAALALGVAAQCGATGPLLGVRTTTTVRRARSLSDIAGRIRLNRAAAGPRQEIVISDINLSDVASRGRISEGSDLGGTTPTMAQQAAATGGVPIGQLSPEERWQKRYQDQQEKIRAMERSMSDYDGRIGDSSTAYTATGPQNRLPGTQSYTEMERQRAQRELAAERQRLQHMRTQARRDGYDVGR